jgi:hypothetical protein
MNSKINNPLIKALKEKYGVTIIEKYDHGMLRRG